MIKKIALFLSLVLIVTMVIPAGVFAQEFDKGLENAIRIAKTRLNIPDGLRFDSSIESNSYQGENRKIFRLSWRNNDAEDEIYNVSIDEKGTILNYNHYNSSDYKVQKKLPKYNRSEAKAFADKFLKIVAPELTGKLRYEENYSSSNLLDSAYYLTYIRVENGIPLYNNTVNVNVNRNSGQVNNYNLSWTDNLTFSDPAKAITAAGAQEAYINKLGLRMIYKYTYENNKVGIYPVYTTKYNNNCMLDALTGQKIEINDSYFGPYYKNEMKEKANLRMASGAAADSVVLTPEELGAVKNAEKIISVEKAESIARSLIYINLNGYKLNHSNLSRNWMFNESFSWYLSFYKAATKESAASYASVTIDAISGDIKNFYTDWKYADDVKGKIKAADAKKAVDEFLKKFKPDLYSQLVFDDAYNIDYSKEKENPAIYNFCYVRKAGGILFPDNTVSISYDAVNEKVVIFDLNWFNVSFPAIDKAIKPEIAYKTLFDNIGLELQYCLKQEENYNASMIMPPVPNITKTKAVLVYSLKPDKPVFIDANTAGLLNYDGKPYIDNKIASYTDIAGNIAENEIRVLAEYGVSLEGKEFKPSEAILQKDFMILLSKAVGYYDGSLTTKATDKSINDMYDYLIKSGIVKAAEKSVNAKVTREEAVKFIIRALKYDRIADLKDMFNCTYTDKNSIAPELTGYVTMAGNLKLIEYGNIVFGPKIEMTRSEAAVLIYKFLQL